MAGQDFWLLDLSTMHSRRLTHLSSADVMRTFDITPDGKRIVFDRLRENSNILLIDLAMNEPRPLQRYFFAGFLLKGQSRAWHLPLEANRVAREPTSVAPSWASSG